jgi:hypothetical protein
MMKIISAILVVLMISVHSGFGQFKSQEQQPSASQSLIHPATSINSFLGFLNPDNFMMHHTFGLSYMSSGGQGLSLASYTNSMFYKIADPLNVRFDVTLQGSPFGQYGSARQGDLSKLFLSNVELNYHPSEKLFLKLQYRQMPFGYWNGYPYSSSLQWGDE